LIPPLVVMKVEDGAFNRRRASVRWDSVGRNPGVGAEVAGSARRRNGRLAAVVNGRLAGRPSARRFL